ncbi:MAG: hypothetical protein JXR58_10070, partial [Bacteroidales bacterium]|nr:hypothetical protein [Bacteroidales bacterium]
MKLNLFPLILLTCCFFIACDSNESDNKSEKTTLIGKWKNIDGQNFCVEFTNDGYFNTLIDGEYLDKNTVKYEYNPNDKINFIYGKEEDDSISFNGKIDFINNDSIKISLMKLNNINETLSSAIFVRIKSLNPPFPPKIKFPNPKNFSYYC